MNIAKRKAEEIVDKYGNDLQDILSSEGIQILEVPLHGRLKELYFGDVVILKDNLSSAEKKRAHRSRFRAPFFTCRQPLGCFFRRLFLG